MNFSELIDAAELVDISKHKQVRLAVLGSHSTQFLHMALTAMGQINEINFEIYEADFDQIEMEIINPQSGMYSFKPEYVFIVQSSLSLQRMFYQLSEPEKQNFDESIVTKNSNPHLS